LARTICCISLTNAWPDNVIRRRLHSELFCHWSINRKIPRRDSSSRRL